MREEPFRIMIKGDPYAIVGQDHLIRNAHICAFTLGNERWLKILTDSWLQKVASKYVVEGIAEDARNVAQSEREWVEKNAKFTLDEVLIRARKDKVADMERWPTDILGLDDPLK